MQGQYPNTYALGLYHGVREYAVISLCTFGTNTTASANTNSSAAITDYIKPSQKAMTRYSLLLLLGTFVMGITAMDMDYWEDYEHEGSDPVCPTPFVLMSNRCIHVDVTVKGTWQEMREYCQSLGSDLAVFSDIKFFYKSLVFLRATGTLADYWIGASDLDVEGQWLWIDGTPVTMGSPYWAIYGCNNEIQPTGGTYSNCAILEHYLYYYLNDVMCWYEAHPFCVM